MKGTGYERISAEETEMVCMSSSNAGARLPVRVAASPGITVRCGHGHSHGGHGHSHAEHGHSHADDDVCVEVTIDDGKSLLKGNRPGKPPSAARDDPAASPDLWRLKVAFALALFFMVVEAVGGLMADSLAVISDVFHLALDVASYGLALLALRYSQSPGTATHTFGHARADVLGALGSISCLWMLNLGLLAEASSRLVEVASLYADARDGGNVDEQSPDGRITATVATVGIAVNLVLVSVLGGRDFGGVHLHGHAHDSHEPSGHGHSHGGHGHSHDSHEHGCSGGGGGGQGGSLSAAYAHAFVDLLQCAAVLFVGCIAWAFPALGALADPLATCVFVVVAFRATWPIAKSAARVLMETAPEGLDVDALRRALEGLGSSGTTDGGLVVRDLHVWSVSMPGGGAVGSVRATVRGRLDAEEHRRLVRRAEAVFAAAGVAHATVQIEGDACVDGGDVACGGTGDGGRGDRHACMLHATRDVAFSRCLKFD